MRRFFILSGLLIAFVATLAGCKGEVAVMPNSTTAFDSKRDQGAGPVGGNPTNMMGKGMKKGGKGASGSGTQPSQ
jgi:hypothetical protein